MKDKVESIKLYKGDCIELLKGVESGSVDMVLCDLPYEVTRNEWDKKIELGKLWKEYKRVLKERGLVVLFGQGVFSAELIMSCKSWYRYSLIWDKCAGGGFLNANRMPLRRHEDIHIFYKKAPTYNPQKSKGRKNHSRGRVEEKENWKNNNYGYFKNIRNEVEGSDWKYPTSILSYKRVAPTKRNHPTEKPVELLEYLIKTYTNEGEVVLDNCAGSGSTGVACVRTGRGFIGIEIDNGYYEIAKERIEKERREVNA